MLSLAELADQDPAVRAVLEDLSISSRTAASQIGRGATAVKDWRRNHLASPYPGSDRMETRFGAAWTPGVEIGPDEGEIRTVPAAALTHDPPADADVLTELGMDPGMWEIVTRRESRWQSPAGDWLRAYRASVRRRGSVTGDLSIESMNGILKAYTSASHGARTVPVAGTYIVPVGDLQAGKIEGGGTGALIERFAQLTGEVACRLSQSFAKPELLILPWLGDCIEGIVSQGGKLALRLDVSVTEQVRIYRRLMLHQLATLAPLAEKIIVPVVPGNHDETYRMLNMPPTDSWAIEGASAVADALNLAGGYEHVRWLFPEPEELTITLDIGSPQEPYVLAFTHGHLASNPGKVIDWWRGQAHGRQATGRADMLFTGHFHHLRIESTGGGRTWFQIPALDGGSEYYRRRRGEDVPAGMISMRLTPGQANGWEGLTVHS